MKKSLLLIIAMLLFLNIYIVTSKDRGIEEEEQVNKKVIEEVYINDDSEIINNMIKHIALAEETLDQFGVNSSYTALDIWVTGIINRNGVMQYSVMSQDLQNQFKKYLSFNENTSWITGEDNVVVSKYQVIEERKVSEKVIIYRVGFTLNINEVEEVRYLDVTTIMDEGRWVLTSISSQSI